MEVSKLEKYEKQYKVEIDSLRNIGKTDDEIYKFILGVEKKLQIEKVKNLVKVLQKSPVSLSNIKALMDYRNLRVLQVYYADELYAARQNAVSEYSDLQIDIMQNEVQKLDRERRNTHNIALSNFCGLLRTYQTLGIKPFHIGEYMDPHNEADHYGNSDVRQHMTDSLFSLLNAIEDIELRELKIENVENKETVENVKKMRQELNSETRGFKFRLDSDDGAVDYR